jgi:hypothetical protein
VRRVRGRRTRKKKKEEEQRTDSLFYINNKTQCFRETLSASLNHIVLITAAVSFVSREVLLKILS